MNNPFVALFTQDQIKKKFRELAFILHPDRGGSTRAMQELNDFYHKALKSIDGKEHKSFTGKTYTYKYSYANEEKLARVLSECLKRLPHTIEILLIGSWLWLSGETKSNVETIRALNTFLQSENLPRFNFCGKKQAWSWHEGKWNRPSSGKSLDALKNTWGSESYQAEAKDELAA